MTVCAACGCAVDDDRTEEELWEEFDKNFEGEEVDRDDPSTYTIVCDDCYAAILGETDQEEDERVLME